MICLQKLIRSPLTQIYRSSVRFYSKGSDSKSSISFKVVKSNEIKDSDDLASLGVIPNWELLAPNSYRFILPGNVGPAWHDATTVAQAGKKEIAITKPSSSYNFKYVIQDCPVLLRKGVVELFSNSDIAENELSIITLSHEQHGTQLLEGDDAVAKCFVLVAQEICTKLRAAGYWADFINPFSGRPYLGPYDGRLYETDEKFRCLGFQVEERANCKVIIHDEMKSFVGSLFTNVPSSMLLLENILESTLNVYIDVSQ